MGIPADVGEAAATGAQPLEGGESVAELLFVVGGGGNGGGGGGEAAEFEQVQLLERFDLAQVDQERVGGVGQLN